MRIEFGKILMVVGAVLFVAGVVLKLNLMPWLGRLPGDIGWRKDNVSFYFPWVTCLVVSVILTLILSFFRK